VAHLGLVVIFQELYRMRQYRSNDPEIFQGTFGASWQVND
jgi:hypothetical protein